MKNQDKSAFRPDINGLRAWAVIAVILYHFGIPGFDGGFVGVDIFFVISGFLMTGIVVKGLERDAFSLVGFYLARARRILPALIVLCAVLLALGWFVLLPPDYKMLSTHAVYALTFLSNIEFWQSAGYFDVASHEKWLLHTWSLSVEWQFYLILPVVLWVVWRIKPGRVAQTWAVGLGLIASFAASVIVTNSQPSAAFYLLHTRAWEMLAGGLVFLLGSKILLSPLQQRSLEVAGLLLIVLTIAIYNKDTAWPGWRALLPVVASAMVLLANRNSFLTTSRLTQWLGDRSYSLYLWHWPVVVALVYLDFLNNPVIVFCALVLTLFLGHASYVLVESTSRRWLEQRRLFFSASSLFIGILTIAFLAFGIWSKEGVSGRFNPSIELAASQSKNINPRRQQCQLSSGLDNPSCIYGGAEYKIITLGDSHSDTLMTSIIPQNNENLVGVLQWSYIGCPFVMDLKKLPTFQANSGGARYKCSEFIENKLTILNSESPKIPVIVVNRYAQAAFGFKKTLGMPDAPEIYFSKMHFSTSKEFLSEFAKKIVDTSCQLAKHRTVYVVRPIPEMEADVPRALSRRMALGNFTDYSIPILKYQQRNDWVWQAQNQARDECGVKILDPTPYLCKGERCYGSLNGHPLYSDDTHLNEYGNKLLVPMFAEVFKNL